MKEIYKHQDLYHPNEKNLPLVTMCWTFQHPFTCTISGPSQSGKTIFLQKLLKALPAYIYPTPTRIVWCYGIENEAQMRKIQACSLLPIEFIEGLPENMDMFSPEDNNLLIIDDLMNHASKINQIADLFTKGSHHRNLSIFLVLQNIFHQGSGMRDIHTSTNYMVLFKNPRDCSQIQFLERQCFPTFKKYLVQAYQQACNRPYGYVIIDLRQDTSDNMRVLSGIFPPEPFVTFVPSTHAAGGK